MTTAKLRRLLERSISWTKCSRLRCTNWICSRSVLRLLDDLADVARQRLRAPSSPRARTRPRRLRHARPARSVRAASARSSAARARSAGTSGSSWRPTPSMVDEARTSIIRSAREPEAESAHQRAEQRRASDRRSTGRAAGLRRRVSTSSASSRRRSREFTSVERLGQREQPFGHPLGVSLTTASSERRQRLAQRPVEPPDVAEIEQADDVAGQDEQIGRVRIGVEQPRARGPA